jgi:hypothetical protein
MLSSCRYWRFGCWLAKKVPWAPTLTYATSVRWFGWVIWRRSGCRKAKGRVPS